MPRREGSDRGYCNEVKPVRDITGLGQGIGYKRGHVNFANDLPAALKQKEQLQEQKEQLQEQKEQLESSLNIVRKRIESS